MAWTKADKQAYAIKKAQERKLEASKKDRRLQPGYQVAPCDHSCDPYDIDYKIEIPGALFAAQCTICGRLWTRIKNRNGFPELTVMPITVKMPSGEPDQAVA